MLTPCGQPHAPRHPAGGDGHHIPGHGTVNLNCCFSGNRHPLGAFGLPWLVTAELWSQEGAWFFLVKAQLLPTASGTGFRSAELL